MLESEIGNEINENTDFPHGILSIGDLDLIFEKKTR